MTEQHTYLGLRKSEIRPQGQSETRATLILSAPPYAQSLILTHPEQTTVGSPSPSGRVHGIVGNESNGQGHDDISVSSDTDSLTPETGA